jgi:hypothetical protein
VGGIAVTGVLNLEVSVYPAFKVALRSHRIQVREHERIGTVHPPPAAPGAAVLRAVAARLRARAPGRARACASVDDAEHQPVAADGGAQAEDQQPHTHNEAVGPGVRTDDAMSKNRLPPDRCRRVQVQ